MAFSGGRKTQLAPHGTSTRKYGTLSHASSGTIACTGIPSAEAFGSAAVGTPRPALTGGKTRLGANGVTKAKRGSFALKNAGLLLTGLASLEAIGNLVIQGGTTQLILSGLSSTESFGTITVSSASTISLTGIASANTFGNHNVTPLGTITCNSINLGQNLISWNANSEPDVAGYRVYISTVSGSILRAAVYDVGNTLSYVVANMTPGDTYYVTVTAYDTSNNESGFSTEVAFVATLGNRFGTANTILGNAVITPTGIATANTFGTHVIAPGNVTVIPSGLPSAETVGAHFIIPDTGAQFLGGIGIASAEAIGSQTFISGDITLDLTNGFVSSAEAFGSHTLFGTQLIDLVDRAIDSLETLGAPLLNIVSPIPTDQTVRLIQVDSTEAFGTAVLPLGILLTGLTSTETFGTLATNVDITSVGNISTDEAYGTMILTPEVVDILLSSIDSTENVGLFILFHSEIQLPVRVFPARQRTFVFTSAR